MFFGDVAAGSVEDGDPNVGVVDHHPDVFVQEIPPDVVVIFFVFRRVDSNSYVLAAKSVTLLTFVSFHDEYVPSFFLRRIDLGVISTSSSSLI